MNRQLHKRPQSSSRVTRPITGQLPLQNQKQAEQCFQMGKKHMIKNQYNEALKHYNNALIHNPKDTKSLCNIGKVYKQLGNFQKSYDFYMQALAINADDMIAIYNLANLERLRCNYENANGLYMRVFKLKEKGIKLGTLDYDSLVNRSICLEKLERYDESIDCCNTAIQLNPNDVSAYFNKSMNLLKKVYESARCLFGNVTKQLCEQTDKQFDKILKIQANRSRCKLGKIQVKFLCDISKQNLERTKKSLLELIKNDSNITNHEISIKIKLFQTLLNNSIKLQTKKLPPIENPPIINNPLQSQKLVPQQPSVKTQQSKVGKQDLTNKKISVQQPIVVGRKQSEPKLTKQTKQQQTDKQKGSESTDKIQQQKQQNIDKVQQKQLEAEIGLIRNQLKQKNYDEAYNKARNLPDQLQKYQLQIEINTLEIEQSSTSTNDKTKLLESAIAIYNQYIINNDQKTIITKDICSERGHEIMANMLNIAGQYTQASKHYAALLQIVEDKKGNSNESKDKIKDIHVGLGSCYSEIGLVKQAIKQYEQSLKIQPKNYFLMTNLCGLLIKDNRSKQAKNIYENFLKENGGKDMPDKIPYIDSLVNISICDKDTPEEAKSLDLAIKQIEEYYPTYEDISKNLDEQAILSIYLRKIDLLEIKLGQNTCTKEESQKINEQLLDSYLSCLQFENCPDREAISINCGILFYLNKFYANSLAFFNVISHPQTQRLIANNIGLAMVHVHQYEKAYSSFSLAVQQNPQNILFNTNFEIIKWIYGVSQLSKLKYSCKCQTMFENRVYFGIYMYDRLTKLLINNAVKSQVEDGSNETIENTVINLINQLMSPIKIIQQKDPESAKYELISKAFNEHLKKCGQHTDTINHQQQDKEIIKKYLKVCPNINQVENGLKAISNYVSGLAEQSPKTTICKGLVCIFLAINSKSLGEQKVRNSWQKFQQNHPNLFLGSNLKALTVQNPEIKQAFSNTNYNRKIKCDKVAPTQTFEIIQKVVKDIQCVVENTLQFAISKIQEIYYSQPDSLVSPLQIIYTHPHCGHTVTCSECLAKYLQIYTTILNKKIKYPLTIKEQQKSSEFFKQMKRFCEECFEQGNPLFQKKEEELEIKLTSKTLPFKIISHHKTLNGVKNFLKVFNKSFILSANDSKNGIQTVQLGKSLILQLWWGDLTVENRIWHQLAQTSDIVSHSNLLINYYIDNLAEIMGQIENTNTNKDSQKDIRSLIRQLLSSK